MIVFSLKDKSCMIITDVHASYCLCVLFEDKNKVPVTPTHYGSIISYGCNLQRQHSSSANLFLFVLSELKENKHLSADTVVQNTKATRETRFSVRKVLPQASAFKHYHLTKLVVLSGALQRKINGLEWYVEPEARVFSSTKVAVICFRHLTWLDYETTSLNTAGLSCL